MVMQREDSGWNGERYRSSKILQFTIINQLDLQNISESHNNYFSQSENA